MIDCLKVREALVALNGVAGVTGGAAAGANDLFYDVVSH